MWDISKSRDIHQPFMQISKKQALTDRVLGFFSKGHQHEYGSNPINVGNTKINRLYKPIHLYIIVLPTFIQVIWNVFLQVYKNSPVITSCIGCIDHSSMARPCNLTMEISSSRGETFPFLSQKLQGSRGVHRFYSHSPASYE